ncbi:hypothetical protein EDC04DRAFT_2811264 [Pisolithus marmoratus]|nr:hypothetical protein EDC04DRAFT_2811264 [Pisolithus marmoratus]
MVEPINQDAVAITIIDVDMAGRSPFQHVALADAFKPGDHVKAGMGQNVDVTSPVVLVSDNDITFMLDPCGGLVDTLYLFRSFITKNTGICLPQIPLTT